MFAHFWYNFYLHFEIYFKHLFEEPLLLKHIYCNKTRTAETIKPRNTIAKEDRSLFPLHVTIPDESLVSGQHSGLFCHLQDTAAKGDYFHLQLTYIPVIRGKMDLVGQINLHHSE